MHRSVATVSLSGTLRQKLEAVAAARFDGIELFENDFVNYNGSATDLRNMAADLGLSIDLYQPFRDFEGMPEQQFKRSLDRAERKFDVMQALGVPLLLVCSNTSPLAINNPDLCAEQLYELAQKAAQRNLRIGFEALAWGKHINLYKQAWNVVEKANHPHLGLILDSFHTLSLNDDPSGIANIPGEKIFFVQMADAPRMSLDVLHWARHHRNFPGQGQLDVVSFFEQALIAGYDGPLSLEIFNDVFRWSSSRRTATDAMRSLMYLENKCRQRLLLKARGTTEDLRAKQVLDRTELFNPPKSSTFHGFSFVEFAVNAESAKSLGNLLEQMGFVFVGRHKSKAVLLYKQGAFNMILNMQANALAGSRLQNNQGSSVCAIGIDSDDPLSAVNRATAFCSARYDSQIGPGETKIPAIRVPGGTILYFTSIKGDRSPYYENDFVLEANATAVNEGLGLNGIDLLSLSLGLDELDTWVLFCRAVLDLEVSDSQFIADPYGLVRSCAVANHTRNVRFVLNVAQSVKTRLAQRVANEGGASIHHVSLKTKDIFKTVRQMRANGVAFVPVSDNYYDDLATRFDIEDGLLNQLQSLGIMFDRTSSGDYYHIYTEEFESRFYFEISQRVAYYEGYGAINNPARMAAQAQS